MKFLLSLLFLLLILIGCSPKVVVNDVKSKSEKVAIESNKPFSFVFDNSLVLDTSDYKGKIEILDSGFSLNCDLPTVKAIAKEKALELGGNLIYVYEHKVPDLKSTCHRLRGKIYRVYNPRDYETEIFWSDLRKLEIADFKGSTEKRPFLAATYSGFSYYIIPKPFTKKYTIKSQTVFDCNLSYFKDSVYNQRTLDHEQIHFDISELYRRKLMAEYARLSLSPAEIRVQHEQILANYWNQLQLKQDEYDSEVYADRSQQSKWDDWIDGELKKYSQYASTELIIQGKK